MPVDKVIIYEDENENWDTYQPGCRANSYE
jgi:hypothetical protein